MKNATATIARPGRPETPGRRCARAAFGVAAIAMLYACAAVPPPRPAAVPSPEADAGHDRVAGAAAPAQGDGAAASAASESRLPAGEGRAILQGACTTCHDLGGLWAYQGYYDRQRWQGLVESMIAHGADLNETETSALVDYLAEHFGPGTRP